MKLTLVAVAFILMIASYFWGYVLLLMNDKPIIAYSIFGILFIGCFDLKCLKQLVIASTKQLVLFGEECCNIFFGNFKGLKQMQKSNVMLSRQSLEQILESLNNIQAFILSLQLTISNPNNEAEQDLFKDLLDNIYNIRLCLPDNSPY